MGKENNNVNEVYKSSGLGKWFDQDWKDISRKKKGGGHPACGASADKGVRAKDSSKKYPKCVPANKAKNMSKKQKKSAVTRKRRAPNEPGKPDNVKTDVKKESWENWKPKSKDVYAGGLPSNNAPENPEPMGGAVAFEKSRKRVLADLNEMIRYLVKEAFYEQERKTPNVGRSGQNVPVGDSSDGNVRAMRSRLERLFSDADFQLRDLETIAETFYDIMKSNQQDKFVDYLQNLPNDVLTAFNSAVEAIETGSDKNWIKDVVGQMSRSIEWNLESSERKRRGMGNIPLASTEFSNAIHSYLDMVNQYVDDPEKKNKLRKFIQSVRFDKNASEQEKERIILFKIRREMAPRAAARNLNENIQIMIIKTVLEEKKLYG